MRVQKINLKQIILQYPIPIFAFLGLLTGILFFISDQKLTAHYIWFATLIIGGAPIAFHTFLGMLKGKFASDIVAMLAIITAIIMEQSFAGAVVVLMQSGGEALEKYGLRRASSSLTALLARAPRIAHRKKDGSIEEIAVKEIKIGDKLVIRPGDLIPVDGTIIEGEAEIDEAAMTGEPLAHYKTIGSRLLSGSIAVNGSLEMRADKTSQESQYAKIVELVRIAQAEKAPIQRLADRYAVFFTPLALLMSILGWLITKDTTTFLAVLVVATPCPLILATPVAVISGINKAAQKGIIVKGGAALEQIGRIQAAVFDKTGTITYGTPYIDEIIPMNKITAHEMLYLAASIEQLSSYSAGQSIVHHAKMHTEKLPLPNNFHEISGRGVEADVEGKQIFIGSQSFIEERLGKDELKPHLAKLTQIQTQGKLVTFIAIDHHFAGVIVLSDHIRTEVPTMIQRLHQLGIEETLLLTGDSYKNSAVIAKQAGISHIKADLLPEQKVQAVEELMLTYPYTMMVGDGINDAPALASATVGIAMGAQGTAISAEAADIVLLVDDISKVADAVYIGRRMLHIATESIVVGIGLSFVLMVIAAFGYIPPPIGALFQEIIDAAVILNALRAR